MTDAQLQARIDELEAELESEASTAVDPAILTRAKSLLQFSINDVKIALEILEITPSKEQREVIEQAILDHKVTGMTEAANKETLAKW